MTITSGHSRRVQSNGGANIQPAGLTERPRAAHGSIGSGLGGNPNWSMSDIWGNNLDDSMVHPTLQEISGSSSLLDSSESDGNGWNANRNVPWPSRAQSSGMTTSPVQSRSTDRGAAALCDRPDVSGYFAQPMSSGVGPSPGTGQMAYDSGSQRISPAGEANTMGNRTLYRSSDMMNAGFVGIPVTTSYQAQSGLTSPLESKRSDHIGSIHIPSVSRTLSNSMRQGNARNGYAHSSHNSASFAPQRPPAHSAFPSFHSESQFSRGGSDSADLSADLGRIQLHEAHNAANRPPYVSYASLDTSINRLRNQDLKDEDSYQPVRGGPGNMALAQNRALAYQTGRSPHARDRDFVSPPDYPLDCPYYAARRNGSNSGSRYRNGLANDVASVEGRLRENQPIDAVCQPPNIISRPQQFSPAYDYGFPNPAIASYYPVAQLNAVAIAHRSRPRGHTASQDTYGPVLAEYRMLNRNKKFELKDVFGHVVEFSGDQHGSRFLQNKIETANSDEKEQVFREIMPECLQLAKDIFGNYVIQKMFEHGNQAQKKAMAGQMKGQVSDLSKAAYGCRVVQKALEHILTDQQVSLVRELEPRILEYVVHPNGNHVIQKAIEKVPSQYTKFVVAAFKGQVETQAKHTYGCRVIQRILEHCDEDDRRSILNELHACAPKLVEDQFGNYVIQHVIQHGEEADRSSMIEVVKQKLLWHSKHKFASNVVEKSIDYGDETQRRDIMTKLTTATESGDSHLVGLMTDQYGNYVFQKILGHLKGAERAVLVERIKPLLPQLKRSNNCGKQIAAIEKLIEDSSPAPNPAIPAPNHPSTTPPNSHKSSPQPMKRSVEDRFMTTPPTPPPIENQHNGESTASLSATASAEVTPAMQ
ncbi:armadillo-type protein [Aspergillus aurantiobrunneus]